jgi:hypothetical protein
MVRVAIVLVIAAAMSASCARTIVVRPLQDVSVRGFVAHAERDWPGTAQQQALTADTLDWLASAVQSLATTKQLRVADLPGRLQAFRALLKEFAAGDPEQLAQTLVLRRTFAAGAALIDDLVAAAGLEPAGDRPPSDVRRAADALDSGRLPRQQAEVIERYFRQASQALQRVDRGA